MSRQVLSAEAGLAPNAVGDLERGNRAIQAQELARICAALSLPLPTLLEEIKAAAESRALPTASGLRKRSKGRRRKNDKPRAELEIVVFRVGGLRSTDGLEASIETLMRLMA